MKKWPNPSVPKDNEEIDELLMSWASSSGNTNANANSNNLTSTSTASTITSTNSSSGYYNTNLR